MAGRIIDTRRAVSEGLPGFQLTCEMLTDVLEYPLPNDEVCRNNVLC